MTEDATPGTGPAKTGKCLGCQDVWPLEGQVLPRHESADEQPGAEPFGGSWVCTGSGHPAARGDALDALRGYAVKRAALASRSSGKLRDDMAEALKKPGWGTARVISHYGPPTVLNETLAKFWADLAAADEPLHVIKDALAALYPNSYGSLVDQAVADAQAAAARQFMTEIRHEIGRTYPDGWNADQVQTVLFSI